MRGGDRLPAAGGGRAQPDCQGRHGGRPLHRRRTGGALSPPSQGRHGGRPLQPTAILILLSVLTLAAQDGNGWRIGDDATEISNPLPLTADLMERGEDLFESNCRRCHGSTGRGNGPDADPEHPPGNLTDARRAPRNPDGVLFYKIWYGRRDPRMPAFGQELSRDEVWTVAHYITSLREPRTE